MTPQAPIKQKNGESELITLRGHFHLKQLTRL